jgi:glycine oxidase
MLAPWCERESAEPLVLELGQRAADWWERHTDQVVRNGTLVVAHARDTADLKRFENLTEGYRSVDAEEIATLEPDLAGRFQRGLFFSKEAHLDPRKALRQLADCVCARGGKIILGEDGRAASFSSDVAIDCRGLSARDQLTDLRGVRGEMLLIRSKEIRLSRPIRLLHPRIPLYIVPRDEGLLMVGATMIESDERGRVSVRSVLELLGAAFSLHPSLGEAEVVEWGADARPALPTNLPRIARHGSTFFVNGLYRHGFLLAPALAIEAARAITDSNPERESIDENPTERQPVRDQLVHGVGNPR